MMDKRNENIRKYIYIIIFILRSKLSDFFGGKKNEGFVSIARPRVC